MHDGGQVRQARRDTSWLTDQMRRDLRLTNETRRSDWFEGWPFPAVLPVFSMGLEEARVMATYVPKLSTRKGKGNVRLLFAKFEF